VLTGNINYQITGLAPFTANPFATVGNDWTLPQQLIPARHARPLAVVAGGQRRQIKQFKQMATAIGKKLAHDGWRGLFGIDAILDEKTGKLYLIEINARQPASTAFESELQKKTGGRGLTIFEAHLIALLKLPYKKQKLIAIKDGAQIVKRMPNAKCQMPNKKLIINKLKKIGLNVIPYENTMPGSDWLRVQSEKGIMAEHNKFNEIGKNIKKILL